KPKPTPPTGDHPGAVQAPPDSSFGEKPPTATGTSSPAASGPAGDWILTSIGGVAVQPGPPGKQAGLRLDPKTSEATGLAVCNQFRGHFELDDAGLRFGPLAATRMACKGGSVDVESNYLKALQETSRWSRDGEVLTLSDAAGKPLLEFRASARNTD
ncbi:MAG TPA: META domain-containing protein, partial [Candidatus Polarisedimenticolia bacterium]|nr:META domain-containing protein [Candidatus Polarisedimenticolia bacterium]